MNRRSRSSGRSGRWVGEELKVPLVINARTDAYRYAAGDEKTLLAEAIRRAEGYKNAGADCVCPMRLVEAEPMSRFVKALGRPVNVMVRKGLPLVKELERMRVSRVSFGPSASYAAVGLLKRIAREVAERGTLGISSMAQSPPTN